MATGYDPEWYKDNDRLWEAFQLLENDLRSARLDIDGLRRDIQERENVIAKLVKERDASPEEKMTADYIRGFKDARRTLRVWFHEAFTQMDSAFDFELENIPKDPGLKNLDGEFQPDVVARARR